MLFLMIVNGFRFKKCNLKHKNVPDFLSGWKCKLMNMDVDKEVNFYLLAFDLIDLLDLHRNLH